MRSTYFPQGIATNTTFCNRVAERSDLRKSIELHEHIVLVGPRKYGKTSLLKQVLKECGYPGISIDFFFVLTQTEAQKQISEAVSALSSQLLSKAPNKYKKLVATLKTFNHKLTLNLLGQKLEVSTSQTSDKSISELLLALDLVAQELKQPCVVVMDEFQQIGELKENHAIEAAIRHAVERSEHVSYIFCGSKRHLLDEMFSNKSRPLYHLCDLMTVDRISRESYLQLLQKKSKSRWKTNIDADSAEEIIHLTERQPYYLNALCRQLWHAEKTPPVGSARRKWDLYVMKQGPWIIKDLSNLTINRRKVLTALAESPKKQPLGGDFALSCGLPTSAIQKCISYLLQEDFIHQNTEGKYKALDPAVSYFIRKHQI